MATLGFHSLDPDTKPLLELAKKQEGIEHKEEKSWDFSSLSPDELKREFKQTQTTFENKLKRLVCTEEGYESHTFDEMHDIREKRSCDWQFNILKSGLNDLCKTRFYKTNRAQKEFPPGELKEIPTCSVPSQALAKYSHDFSKIYLEVMSAVDSIENEVNQLEKHFQNKMLGCFLDCLSIWLICKDNLHYRGDHDAGIKELRKDIASIKTFFTSTQELFKKNQALRAELISRGFSVQSPSEEFEQWHKANYPNYQKNNTPHPN